MTDQRDRIADIARSNSVPRSIAGALFALEVLRLSGCREPECVDPPTDAPRGIQAAAIQALARRAEAWVTSSPPVPCMKRGDVWVAADENGDTETGVCLEDAILLKGGAWLVMTVDRSDKPIPGVVGRRFVPDGARLRLGSKYLLGYLSAGKLPGGPPLAAPAP